MRLFCGPIGDRPRLTPIIVTPGRPPGLAPRYPPLEHAADFFLELIITQHIIAVGCGTDFGNIFRLDVCYFSILTVSLHIGTEGRGRWSGVTVHHELLADERQGHSRHRRKISVPSEHRQTVPLCRCGDPNVIGRNRCAGALQGLHDHGIEFRGFRVDLQ